MVLWVEDWVRSAVGSDHVARASLATQGIMSYPSRRRTFEEGRGYQLRVDVGGCHVIHDDTCDGGSFSPMRQCSRGGTDLHALLICEDVTKQRGLASAKETAYRASGLSSTWWFVTYERLTH